MTSYELARLTDGLIVAQPQRSEFFHLARPESGVSLCGTSVCGVVLLAHIKAALWRDFPLCAECYAVRKQDIDAVDDLVGA